MEESPFRRTITALNDSGEPYVIVGGFAVVMHGVSRFTPDMNIIVPFEQGSIERICSTLESHHFIPFGSVTREQFQNPSERENLIEKGHWFYTFVDEQAPTFRIDLFLQHPIPFVELRDEAMDVSFHEGGTKVCSFDHLMKLKRLADRGQDKVDVENLEIVEVIKKFEGDAEKIRNNLPASAHDRVEDLISFCALSPDKKADWLLDMLTEIGKFCIV